MMNIMVTSLNIRFFFFQKNLLRFSRFCLRTNTNKAFACCWICFWLILFIPGKAIVAQRNLDYFLVQAKENSPLLKDFQYQRRRNAIDSLQIKASYMPQVDANFIGLYAPVSGGWGYDEAITNLHTINATVSVTQPIISKRNLQNQYYTIQLQNLGLQNQSDVTEQDVRREITGQYITAYGDLLQVNFNEQMLSSLQDEESFLKALAENGVYKQTDYLAFLVTIQQQKLLITQLKNQYQNDLGNLNYISGIQDTSYTILPPPDLNLNEILPIEETIFLKEFEIDSLKIKASDAQIDFSYRPRANVFADAGYFSSFLLTPYKNFGYSAGLNLTIPIYDGRQRDMLHSKNVIEEESRMTKQHYF
ncbi:MAG: TolC family protein, partial [Saprospiraceae bacterium]